MFSIKPQQFFPPFCGFEILLNKNCQNKSFLLIWFSAFSDKSLMIDFERKLLISARPFERENTGCCKCVGVSSTMARSSSLCHKSVDLKKLEKIPQFLSGNLLVVSSENEMSPGCRLLLIWASFYSADSMYYIILSRQRGNEYRNKETISTQICNT